MNLIHVLSVLNLLFSFIFFYLAFLIGRENFDEKRDLIFMFLCVILGLVPFSNFFIDFFNQKEIVGLFIRFAYTLPILFSVLLIYFSLIFPKKRDLSTLKKIVIFSPLFLLFLIPTDYSIKSFSTFVDKPTQINTGFLITLILALVIISVIYSLSQLYKSYKSSKRRERLQIKYVITGLSLSVLVVIITNILLPILGYNWPAVLGSFLFGVPFIISTFYAIKAHKLMDIRKPIKTSFVYMGSLGILTFLYSAFIYIFIEYWGFSANKTTLYQSSFIVVFLILIFHQVKKIFDIVTNKLFFRNKVDYRKVIDKTNDIFISELDLNTLINKTINFLKKELKLNKISVLLIINNKEKIFYSTEEKNNLDINLSEVFSKIKDKNKNFFLKEELEKDISKLLNGFNFNIFSFLESKDVKALLFFGDKLNEEPFFKKDFEWLNVLRDEFQVALERSNLYKNLEKKVEKKTKNIRRKNEKLKKMNEAKTEFVSIASHQLRSPITTLKGIFSLFLSGDLGETTNKQEEFARKGKRKSEDLSNLIEKLLSISRIESNTLDLDLENTNLNDLIKKELEKGLRSKIKNKELKLELNLSKALPDIKIDQGLISEAIYNLVDNAVKYTEEGFIKIATYQRKDRIYVKVEDSGKGISEEELPKIFDKHKRSDRPDIKSVGGTGLGLYFCKRLMEAHNGEINVETKGVGEGTIFFLEFIDK